MAVATMACNDNDNVHEDNNEEVELELVDEEHDNILFLDLNSISLDIDKSICKGVPNCTLLFHSHALTKRG